MYFQAESSKAPDSRRVDVLVGAEGRIRSMSMFQLKTVSQELFPLTHRRVSLFVLFRTLTNWMGAGQSAYSVYWFKC